MSSEKIEFSRAEKAQSQGDREGALAHYRAVVDKSVKTPLAIRAAKEAARISNYDLKKFNDAIAFYRHVILYAPVESDRVDAEKHIADIEFNQTLDYTDAITDYNRLLELPHSPAEETTYRMALARSYFYLGNFYQSQVEIDHLIQPDPKLPPKTDDSVFEPLLLKANILLTTKKIDDAITVLHDLMQKFPKRAQTESVGLVLAICYEEQKNFAKAIETLQAVQQTDPRKEFLAGKIKALKERQSYLPGAKGFHK